MIVRLLLDHGADVNVRDNDSTTPLYCALQEGHLEVVQLLLGCGAGADARGKSRQTPLHLALQDRRR
jgi:ankyrin repeat protein